MKSLILFFPLIFFSQDIFCQVSTANEEIQVLRSFYNYPTEKWDSLRCVRYNECAIPNPKIDFLRSTACPLVKKVFGWYMPGTNYNNFVWQSISDFSYFSYDVNPATGNAINTTQIANWQNDAGIVAARNNGVRISLTATLFNNSNQFSTFFGSATAQQNLRTKLINAVIAANAKGINIDFEGTGLNSTYLPQFVSFISALSSQLHSSVSNSELTIDLYGSNSQSTNMLTQLNPFIDYFIMMGYDYYWGSQGSPGPIGPTYKFYSIIWNS